MSRDDPDNETGRIYADMVIPIILADGEDELRRLAAKRDLVKRALWWACLQDDVVAAYGDQEA